MYEIKDKVFLITGAACGIGARVVESLLQEDAKTVVVLDIMESQERNLEEANNSKYGINKVKFYVCDVTREEQVDEVFNEVIKEFEYIDTVINNAGIINDSENCFRKEIEINLVSAKLALISISWKAYKLMRVDQGGKGGTIVNISSIAALTQFLPLPIYSATKSAVLQFSLCLGADVNYNRSSVRVIAVCFGPTDTSLIDKNKIGFLDELFKQDYGNVKIWSNAQSINVAAYGLIDALKRAEKGAVWLVTPEVPSKDFTANVKKELKDFRVSQKSTSKQKPSIDWEQE